MGASSSSTPILELRNISKAFPGVQALDDVHFDLFPGEIHSLIGENGAGKSTFNKIITGVHDPDAGTSRRPSSRRSSAGSSR